MLNISKIKINDTTYDIKDPNAILKSGDTMTGDLTIAKSDNSSIILKTTSSNAHGSIRAYADSNLSSNGVNMVIAPGGTMLVGSGESASSIYSENVDSAAGANEKLFLSSDNDTYLYTNCNTVANRYTWHFKNDGMSDFPGRISIIEPHYTTNGNPSSAVYHLDGVYDSAGNLFSYLQTTQYNNGGHNLQLAVRTKTSSGNVDNGIGFTVAADGTRSVSLDYKAGWLNALGLSDSGWKALNTTHNCYYRKFGPIVTVIISTSTDFATGEHNMGTLPSGYRPKYPVFVETYPNHSRFSVNSSGPVVLISQGNTGNPTRCCCSFLVA